jgi:hypothetical protein
MTGTVLLFYFIFLVVQGFELRALLGGALLLVPRPQHNQALFYNLEAQH